MSEALAQGDYSDAIYRKLVSEAHAMAEETRATKPTSVVYFIGAPSSGLIKIGTTDRLKGRIGDLRRGSPVEIEVLAVAPGDRRLESHYHAMFAMQRQHGEWFLPSERLLNEISRVKVNWTWQHQLR